MKMQEVIDHDPLADLVEPDTRPDSAAAEETAAVIDRLFGELHRGEVQDPTHLRLDRLAKGLVWNGVPLATIEGAVADRVRAELGDQATPELVEQYLVGTARRVHAATPDAVRVEFDAEG